MTTVLVVDDSPTVRELVSEHLRQQNIAVVEAFDGLDATEKIKISVPDLVITDVVMPRMNGYELCRWIKNNVKNKNVPVVMCTTKSEEFDKYWGMKQGADAYITKPYNPPELIDIVKRLIRMMAN
ncbi:response regulator with CheY-like receiver domain and winged-helix DNA-binding domain [Synechococcus sp. PCC 7502]|uniref:response regulator transcription factor n=1 Tax=Synechococcus sp. PCC 7502 TaxID=1173263 RepID=UPI00029F9C7B|nr:response regulator [Synechococcus sp. PCC 7502]AFY74300.1 response regulator with CheY-like receiver domain and winged-helix DNA-binding domain [Synechococcus sp. PCC 7502]